MLAAAAGLSASPRLRADLQRAGAHAAFAACVLNGLWLACLVYLTGLGDTAAQVERNAALFRLSVGSCLVITFLEVPILLALVVTAAERDPARSIIGGVFYALYIPLNFIGYFLFGRLAPIAHARPHGDPIAAELVARQIEIGHPLALTGMLPVLGYGVLGVAFCLLALGLRGKSRLWTATAALLFASGAASIVGAFGGFVASSWLEKGSLIGGVISLPALACVARGLYTEARRGL